MAPIAIDDRIVDTVQPKKDTLGLPMAARERLQRAGVDLSNVCSHVNQTTVSHCSAMPEHHIFSQSLISTGLPIQAS